VGNYLVASRKRLYEIIVDILAETVTSERDLQEEIEELFGAF
jgi:hypothetical protein